METGPPFYVVIRATRRSSRLQGKGSTFISQLFLRPWVLVRPRESNPRPPALQSSALPTELILPRLANPTAGGKRSRKSCFPARVGCLAWKLERFYSLSGILHQGVPEPRIAFLPSLHGFRVGNVSRKKVRAAGVGVERLTWTWACRQETKYPATSMKIKMRLTVIDFCSVSRAKHMPVGSHNHGGQSG